MFKLLGLFFFFFLHLDFFVHPDKESIRKIWFFLFFLFCFFFFVVVFFLLFFFSFVFGFFLATKHI